MWSGRTEIFVWCAGVCYHGLGDHEKAINDYVRAYEIVLASPGTSDFSHRKLSEVFTFQYLSYYQSQLALYSKHVLDTPVHDASLDRDLPPEFKVSLALRTSAQQLICMDHLHSHL